MAQHILTLTIQQLDDNGETLARRVHAITEDNPTAGEFVAGVLADTSQATIGLPVTQPRQIMFVNTHASAKITVVWTPYGGSEATINTVGPGGACVLFDKTTAGSGIGVSSLKLTSDTNGGTYELFIGG